MAPERVYKAARRLRVSSRRLLVYLEAHDAPHASASSTLTTAGKALVAEATTSQILLDSARHYRPKPVPVGAYWSWQEMDPRLRGDRQLYFSNSAIVAKKPLVSA